MELVKQMGGLLLHVTACGKRETVSLAASHRNWLFRKIPSAVPGTATSFPIGQRLWRKMNLLPIRRPSVAGHFIAAEKEIKSLWLVKQCFTRSMSYLWIKFQVVDSVDKFPMTSKGV